MLVVHVDPRVEMTVSVSSIPHEPGGWCYQTDGPQIIEEVAVNVVEYMGHKYQFRQDDVQGNVAAAFDVGTAEPVCLIFPEPW